MRKTFGFYAVAMSLLMRGVTLAQSGGVEVDPAPDRSYWPAITIAIVLILCVGVASMNPSKRTHRD